jgi:hypothetical protein
MIMTPTKLFRQDGPQISPGNATQHQANEAALDHAVRLVHHVCCLAGPATLIEDLRRESRADGIRSAIEIHDSAKLFDWLMGAFSLQGISDRVANDYIRRHGPVTWADIDRKLGCGATCPKLESYWQFHGCRYDKISRTCAEPEHIAECPLPTHHLRNGRLNQTAYSLFLFIRDVAAGDLVGWIDSQLDEADRPDAPDRLAQMRQAVLGPLRHVYGISDKVISMALACLFIGAPKSRARWIEVGATMIAVDTLVHNFLHRTGILGRFHADHPYGSGCYRPNGCADILGLIATRIDAKAFNPKFPKVFPRFVQSAVWRYCGENGMDVCNGNRINDMHRCNNVYCRVRSMCDRVILREEEARKLMISTA